MTTPSTTGAERDALRRTARRLGLQTAVLVLGCLVVVGAAVLLVVVRAQDEAARSRLEGAVSSIDDAQDAPPGMWVAVASPRGLSTSEGLPESLPDVDVMREVARSGEDVWTTAPTDAGTVRVLTGRHDGTVVQAAEDPTESREELARLVVALLAAGAVGMVLAGLGAVWLTRRAVQPMVAALNLQRRFVADASHELRTPLTLLSTRAQLLDRHMTTDWGSGPPDRVQHDVDGLLADAAALTSVLDDMLLAADARSVDAVPVDASALVQDVVDAAQAMAMEMEIALTRGGDAQASVLASPVSLRRAVTALVDNAIDHATATVDVGVSVRGDRVLVEVRDDGPGLPETDQLFRRFASHRDARTSGDDRRHYGIGLALVAEVAAQHGGSVSASARTDGRPGAAVTLELPAAR
ncbi:sensor histidine kinase [Cellulomonas humilata]|uniref:histidine kinase n=1 Tax=Cellulomonas humilata TaxID=144055 RepID=A0ABU0EKK9_9CELL|nr:HAMP domain-containing sensor histidine kinase [Cellulomonas humilata]MDQ0375826.1 signal transduction histidine kinase [Cellulomonas humilata]